MLDFACGSGSLLLNVRRHVEVDEGGKDTGGTIGKIFGQEAEF